MYKKELEQAVKQLNLKNRRDGHFQVARNNMGVCVVFVKLSDGNEVVTFPVQGAYASSREAYVATQAFMSGMGW